MTKLNWFFLRVLWLFSPAVLILALAALAQGWLAAAGVFAAMSLVMAASGYRTRGQRFGPSDE